MLEVKHGTSTERAETHKACIWFIIKTHRLSNKTTSSFAGGFCKQLGPRSGLTT